jgi:hypothetical protein
MITDFVELCKEDRQKHFCSTCVGLVNVDASMDAEIFYFFTVNFPHCCCDSNMNVCLKFDKKQANKKQVKTFKIEPLSLF